MEIQDQKAGSSDRNNAVAIGVVTEALPNTLFKVNIGNDKQLLAYLSGKMRLNRIRVLIGDRVELILDPYGGRGRITRRL
ncbi:MAG: translation initiation factor IF-1 [Candidatus Vogelbacteria bacterium]|nr:translation initiation factor IF-1 [Candidatus Vogelbacteria bacterium]